MEDHELSRSEGETGGFEKRVHQKMLDLELAPSHAVWEKVNEKLHPDNKRSRWLVWLMLLLAGLGLGGYLVWNGAGSSDHNKSSLSKNNSTGSQPDKNGLAVPDQNKTIKPAETGLHQNESITDLSVAKKDNPTTPGKEDATVNKESTTSGNTPEAQTRSHAPKSKPGSGLSKGKREAALLATNKTGRPVLEQAGTAQNNVIARQDIERLNNANDIENTYLENNRRENETEELTIRNPDPRLVDTQIKSTQVINTALGLTMGNASAFGSGIKLKRPSRLSWGLVLNGGRSTMSSGSINTIFQSSSPMFDSQGLVQSGNTMLPRPVPSVVKAGPAFAIGAVIKKQMTARLSMSVGLNYNQYTLSNKVGQKVDSTINFSGAFAGSRMAVEEYYKTGNSKKYISRYHFIELPVLLHTRLTENKRMPLSLDLGLSVSRLVSSNALHYNSSSGIYYKDNDLFKKTQVNLVAGLPIKIFYSDKFSIDAGPHFQYGITKLIADQTTGNKHFVFLGIKAGILFTKK